MNCHGHNTNHENFCENYSNVDSYVDVKHFDEGEITMPKIDDENSGKEYILIKHLLEDLETLEDDIKNLEKKISKKFSYGSTTIDNNFNSMHISLFEISKKLKTLIKAKDLI